MNKMPLIFFVSALALGCASSAPEQNNIGVSYPDAYQQALMQFQGTPQVQTTDINDFINFLSNLGADDTADRARELYAQDLYFSDALMLTDSKDAVVAHFRGLVDGGARVEVDMLDVLLQGSDVYLVWKMTAEFQPIRKPVTSTTIGVTHARFNTAGEVVLHQDFWDTGLGFYQNVPGLGTVIKAINRRFTAEETQR